jgi:hypothetical protein
MRSRIVEAQALLDRQGLGSFDAVTWQPQSPIRAVRDQMDSFHP